jgi:hypothetical protein
MRSHTPLIAIILHQRCEGNDATMNLQPACLSLAGFTLPEHRCVSPQVTRCAHMLLSTSRTALVAPQRAALRVAPRHARTQQLHRQHHQSVKTDSRGFMGLVYTAAASAATWLCGVGQTLAAHMCGPKQCTQDAHHFHGVALPPKGSARVAWRHVPLISSAAVSPGEQVGGRW